MRSVELQIQDIAFGGKGIARDAGKAVFIPFTIDGERVTSKIVREKKQFAEPPMRPIVPSPLPYAYRNRITVHVLDEAVGFYRRDAHELMVLWPRSRG